MPIGYEGEDIEPSPLLAFPTYGIPYLTQIGGFMRFQFSFKHMEVSPALQKITEEKIRSQIDKFVTKPIEAHVTFSVERHLHNVHLVLTGGDGFSLHVEHACDDMYGSVDRMLDKLAVKLRRTKGKIKHHKVKNSTKNFSLSTPEVEPEIDAEDIIKYERARKKIAAGA
jgi:putative sigma-54 modulation protein